MRRLLFTAATVLATVAPSIAGATAASAGAPGPAIPAGAPGPAIPAGAPGPAIPAGAPGPAASAGAHVPDRAECPRDLDCRWLPAAYASNNPADANAYGNYDPADRPRDLPIRYIVIHDTESSYQSTLASFQNPTAYTSAHYVIRSSDGEVTQMVRTSDIAWHAGNSLVNDESIGIEHEGYAADGSVWFTDAMYRNSAALVRYLAARYHIPLDRDHIVGHDDIAHQRNYTGSHWDPGPFWNWSYFMKLLHAPATRPGSRLVTLAPNFAANQQELTYCTTSGCRTLPKQPSSTTLLRAEPRDDAPLITDPVLGGGSTDAADWSDKAAYGRTYAVAERRGRWTAVWFGGRKAWLHTNVTRPAAGRLVRPRAGVQVPVYTANLPNPDEWPAGTPAGNPATPPALNPVYTISGDQRYELADAGPALIYYARFDGNDVPFNHTVIRGAATFYRISFNHRFMYVKASDVELR
ncbi:N-acetylmuramoyl-L-alanine amidase [Actinoplanes sp. NPDC049265]|uniref:N-acetylmuramoyl-L-alanine amidase n=1 Tax=Actinoplanes sp. NPDC049265 TaxID=3363902 RepID=UPI00371B51D0